MIFRGGIKMKLQVKKLTQEEEIELFKKAKVGCSVSRDRLITSHIPLVWKVIKTFKYNGNKFDEEDMFSEGLVGLISAVDKFDIESGNRLSYYALMWIKEYAKRFIYRNNSLKASFNDIKNVYKGTPEEVEAKKAEVFKKGIELENFTQNEVQYRVFEKSGKSYDVKGICIRDTFEELLIKFNCSSFEKDAIIYKWIDNYSMEEIFNKTGITENNFKELEKNIKKKLSHIKPINTKKTTQKLQKMIVEPQSEYVA